jgi:hypothetical protein
MENPVRPKATATVETPIAAGPVTNGASSSERVPSLAGTRVLLTEDGGEVMLDITDDRSGLGMKLYFRAHVAHDLGYAIMERARAIVAKASDDPVRGEAKTFQAEA